MTVKFTPDALRLHALWIADAEIPEPVREPILVSIRRAYFRELMAERNALELRIRELEAQLKGDLPAACVSVDTWVGVTQAKDAAEAQALGFRRAAERWCEQAGRYRRALPWVGLAAFAVGGMTLAAVWGWLR